jgi:ankyrin repeat protein
MKLLLDAGAETHWRDLKHGWTALHLAVIAGNVVGARMLVKAGADVALLDRSGADVRTLLEENDIDPTSVLGEK